MMLTRRPVRYVQTFSRVQVSLAVGDVRLNAGLMLEDLQHSLAQPIGLMLGFELIPPDAFFYIYIYKKIPPASDKVNLILIEGSPSLSRPRHNEVSADDE